MACPWCAEPVPPKTRGRDRRFCSTACRHRYRAACANIGRLVLERGVDFARVFSGADLDLIRSELPPGDAGRLAEVRGLNAPAV